MVGVPSEPPRVPQPLTPPLLHALEFPPGGGDVDPELVNLPDPPRQGRTLTILILLLSVVGSLGMVLALARDAAYALLSAAPANLGDLGTADGPTLRSLDNKFVSAEGRLGAAGGIRYERPLRDDTFRALPVAGRTDLWVEVRIPPKEETGRWEPPRSFAGHLTALDAVGPSHRGLRGAIEGLTNTAIPRAAWVLADGEEPSGARWVVLLAAAFLGAAAFNALALVRIVRKPS